MPPPPPSLRPLCFSFGPHNMRKALINSNQQHVRSTATATLRRVSKPVHAVLSNAGVSSKTRPSTHSGPAPHFKKPAAATIRSEIRRIAIALDVIRAVPGPDIRSPWNFQPRQTYTRRRTTTTLLQSIYCKSGAFSRERSTTITHVRGRS